MNRNEQKSVDSYFFCFFLSCRVESAVGLGVSGSFNGDFAD